jgi:Ca-activated chloride channel family protein
MIGFILEKFQDIILAFVKLLFGPADSFKNPEFLLMLLVLPIFLVWYNFVYAPRRLIFRLSYDPTKLLKPRLNLAFLRFIPYLLLASALFFMIIAMARPISSLERKDRYSEGIDIMLVLDASGSMETPDFDTTRIAVAKRTAVRFVDGRVDDRIGIVLFAEDAFSYAPLTLDYQLLKKLIESINTDMMPKEGTAVGSAISVAINRLDESKSPSKVMVLLTDGASNRGQIDPITAAKVASEKRVKIYTIGIGKEEFVQRGPFGSQVVKSDLDEKSMQEIADLTGGKFYRCTDEKGLQAIFDEISNMEKVEIKVDEYREETDLYVNVLLTGLALLTLAFVSMATFIHNPLEG